MSKVDVRGLSILTREATELTNRSKLNSIEEKRFNLLMAQISVLKQGGITLAELQDAEVNEISARHGLPVTRTTKSSLNPEERAKAEAWRTFVNIERENRTADETEGNLLAHIGTYSGLGTFVQTEMIREVYFAMAAHDAFLDENAVTVINDTKGYPKTVPTVGDIENVASVMGEAADASGSGANIDAPGHAKLGAYSYRSPLWRLSIEAMQDVEAMGGAVALFKKFAADRIARGVAKDLAVGNSAGNKPFGIVPSLQAAGVTGVTATGSAKNTGGTEDGTNSIGSQDLAALYLSVNEAYRVNPKCAWFMNDTTRLYLSQIVTKQGLPLVNYENGQGYIYTKPIRIAPSLDNIGAGKVPVVFGDGQYWCTRKIVDDQTYVRLVKEAPGLIENGEMALQMFARFDGALAYNDSGSPSPFSFIINHT